MMKNIYLALKLIMKSKFFTLLIIFNIAVSSHFLFPLLSNYLDFRQAKATVERIETENVYYILTSSPYMFNSYLYEAFHDKAEKNDYIDSVCEVYQLFETSHKYNLLSYDEPIINHFSPFLAKGKWFTDYESQDMNRIPVVVAQGTGYDTNDIFRIEINNHDYSKTLPVDCVVIGVIDTPTQFLELSGGSADEYFTLDFLLGSDTNTIILPLSLEIYDLASPYFHWCSSPGKLIYTNSSVDYETVKKDFGYYGEVTDMSNGKSRFYTDMNYYLMYVGYIVLTYSLIAIISVASLNIIQNIRNRRNFTIYYLSGMSRNQCILIELTRVFSLMLISMLAVIGYFIIGGYIRFIFEPGQYAIALTTLLLYVAIIFIPVSIGFILGTMRYNIIDAVKQLFLDQ